MGIFRSDEIIHKKIRLPGNIERAIQILDTLGNIEETTIQFIDLTANDIEAKKSFNPMIKRCEDVIKAIYTFNVLSKQFKVKIFCYEDYHRFKHDLNIDQSLRNMENGAYFDVLESEIAEEDKKMLDLVESYEKVSDNIELEIEKKLVFEKINSLLQLKDRESYSFLPSQSSNIANNNDNHLNISIDFEDEEDAPFHSHNNSNSSLVVNSLLFIIGVARAEDEMKMKRMVFRTSRGRAMASFFDLNANSNEKKAVLRNKAPKKIFAIFYSSEGREILRSKLTQICDLFNASRYTPDMSKKMIENIREVTKSIAEKKNYFHHSEKSIIDFLREMSGDESKPGKIDLYKLFFSKMKMIYINLNKCIHRENFIDGEVWIVKEHYNKVNQCLSARRDQSDITNGTFIKLYETNLIKPTYISSNDFMRPPQDIVNTYGVPRYQEINPAYFNSVFFPFLFGIMFGDIGHGLLLLILGIVLCIRSDNIKTRLNSLMIYIVPYRYLILLMGCFSFYCGCLYNDFLCVPIPIFKSCYSKFAQRKNCVYPFGIDSKWYAAKNKLAFFNSFKMKFSVIVGVIQMLFGIFLKGLNAIFYNDWLTFAFEFIPQFTFMILIFGYMIVMIFIKWSTSWGNDIEKAPSLITQLISMFLNLGSVNNLPLWGGKNKDGEYVQETFQFNILIISFTMIPLMCLPKPLIEYYFYAEIKKDNVQEENDHLNDGIGQIHYSYLHNKIGVRKETLANMLITQLIETIEFVLGSISSTASYLRLWALSLAHSQLSHVFFEKTMLNTFNQGNLYYGGSLVMIVIAFFLFANITIFVLMFMDLMECFLHALRLHWVEFQNKFYKADGYLFEPFSFQYLINNNEAFVSSE